MKKTLILFTKASAEWDKENYKSAFELFSKIEQLGDPSARLNIGLCYHEGLGVKKSFRKALYWYKQDLKSEQHKSPAYSNIAMLYQEARKWRRALHWWRKAIELGDGDAALDLAKIYLKSKRKNLRYKGYRLLKTVLKSPHVTIDSLEEAKKLLSTEE